MNRHVLLALFISILMCFSQKPHAQESLQKCFESAEWDLAEEEAYENCLVAVEANPDNKYAQYYLGVSTILTQTPLHQFPTMQYELDRRQQNPSKSELNGILKAEQHLELAAKMGVKEAHYALGVLKMQTKKAKVLNNGSESSREQEALLHYIAAADLKDRKGIKAVSNWAVRQMSEDKMPLKFQYLLPYMKAHWSNGDGRAGWYYTQHTKWMDEVNLADTDPDALSPDALFSIASQYEDGWFLEKSIDRAYALFDLAMKRGNVSAQYKIGVRKYESGEVETALELLKNAASFDNADAMLKLGDHFGCIGDNNLAIEWYDKAIAAGNEYAQDEKYHMEKNGKPSICE